MKAASTCCKVTEFLVNGLKDKLPVPVCISGFFFLAHSKMLTPIKTSFEKSRFWLKNRKLCGRRSLEFSSARRVKWWNIISVSLMEICYIEMTTLYPLFKCPRPINRVVRLTRVSLTVKIREINLRILATVLLIEGVRLIQISLYVN